MKLYVAISHHGLGHLAQTAPVLNALRARHPALDLIVRSALPEAAVRQRVRGPFNYLAAASDCNLVMHDAVRVDVEASLAAYRTFHENWPARVDAEARALDSLGVDAVFSNVGYLPLAAAQRVGLPAFALCSLNWADIFAHYLDGAPDSAAILTEIRAAYAAARVFLRPTPAMPMADLANTLALPPIAETGLNRWRELIGCLGLAAGTRIVLVGLGGIPYRLALDQWPHMPGLCLLVPDDWPGAHPAVRLFSETGLPFADLLASADALITKPGYGSYVEAAAAGVPVLTITRPDWPEAPVLNTWLTAHGRSREIDAAVLRDGTLAVELEKLWAQPARPTPPTAGAARAAEVIAAQLG